MKRNAVAEPEQDQRTMRLNLTVRNETVNVETRSVEVVLATENRTTVFDAASRHVIEEVLLMDGMIAVEHVPMLNDHNRFSLDGQFGSVREFRIVGKKLHCRFYFADLKEIDNDEEAKRIERAWIKVRDGHLKAVSIGYRVFEGVMIPPGESRKVRGTIYTAGELPLRVATRWKPREGSLTVIQADDASTIRNSEQGTMNEKLLKHLRSIGLRKDATNGEAWKYLGTLKDSQRSTAEALITDEDQVPDTFTRSEQPETSVQSDTTTNVDHSRTGSAASPAVDSARAAAADVDFTDAQRSAMDDLFQTQLRSERQRVADVQRTFETAGIDNQPLMARAINENWTAQQTAAELLPLVRSRSQSVAADNGHIGIHVTRAADSNALAAAMLLREGMRLDHPVFESDYAVRSAIPLTLRQSLNSDNRQQAMEIAHRYETMSLVDLCRAGLQLEGRQVPHHRDEMIRAATSSAAVSDIFTTNVSARVLASYMDADDTSAMWTTEDDVPNFQTNERHTMGKFGSLTRHARGKTADDLDIDSTKEEYKIARYSGKFVIDEMDIIDDRLGGINAVTPEDMGLSARQLRPNLCYGELLRNASLSDSVALFHADHSNLGTTGTALAIATLGAGYTAMMKQRIKTRILNLAPKYILVPPELALLTAQILESVEIRESAASNGVRNFLVNKGLVAIADDRLAVAGVRNPANDTHYAGTATNYFLVCEPGRNGAKTIEVGYLRGTGRAPQVRSMSMMELGCWGFGHDIKMDIGAKPLDFRGMRKHTGEA